MSLRHQGIILLNQRINYFNGNAPDPDDNSFAGIHARSPYWAVVKHTATGDIWAKSTHGAARVAHRLRYQLVATHVRTGEVVKLTVWKCARRSHSEIKVGKRPLKLNERCWLCSKV